MKSAVFRATGLTCQKSARFAGGVLVCIVLFLLSARSSVAAELQPPNIVFVLIDDLGWMDLGCQGNPHLSTPHIDRMAEQGLRFTDAYAAAPVCSPTRAAIMTGRSPARLKITNHLPEQARFTPPDSTLLPARMKDHLDLEYVTIAERLKCDAGYATAFVGKWHLYTGRQHQFAPNHQGFDVNIGGCSYGGPPGYFDPYRIPFLQDRRPGEYLPNRLVDEAIGFMRQAAENEKPFFVALFTYTVHWPMQAPADLIDKYSARPRKGYRDHRYAAMIEAMDLAIGRLLSTLDDMQLTRQTLVVLTSDNGPFGGVGDPSPLRGDKGHLFEGGIRVPLIVRWPGVVKPGTTTSVPVILTDFYPTLLDAAGIELKPEDQIDGVSLLPLLQRDEAPTRDALFWHYPNFAFHRDNRPGSAVRMQEYKLIEFFDDESTELYHLPTDISERHDLSGQEPERVNRMRERLRAWRQESGAELPRRRDQQESCSGNLSGVPVR